MKRLWDGIYLEWKILNFGIAIFAGFSIEFRSDFFIEDAIFLDFDEILRSSRGQVRDSGLAANFCLFRTF